MYRFTPALFLAALISAMIIPSMAKAEDVATLELLVRAAELRLEVSRTSLYQAENACLRARVDYEKSIEALRYREQMCPTITETMQQLESEIHKVDSVLRLELEEALTQMRDRRFVVLCDITTPTSQRDVIAPEQALRAGKALIAARTQALMKFSEVRRLEERLARAKGLPILPKKRLPIPDVFRVEVIIHKQQLPEAFADCYPMDSTKS